MSSASLTKEGKETARKRWIGDSDTSSDTPMSMVEAGLVDASNAPFLDLML